MDYSLIALVGVTGGVITLIVWQVRLYLTAQARANNKNAQMTKGSKPILDFVDLALGEIAKTAEEMKKLGVTPEQLKPLEKRYNWLKWVKDNDGISVPLIEGGQKLIEGFIKGFLGGP